MLVTGSDIRAGTVRYLHDRENIVDRMDDEAVGEVRDVINSRFDTAKQSTLDLREKMNNWDKQYNGEFQDQEEDDERIFIPKSREQVDTIIAFVIGMFAQLNPIITAEPMTSTLWHAKQEYERAKLVEAMLDFHFTDLWKVKDVFLPKFMRHFLKYTMGVGRVIYREDDMKPDLLLDVVDRAFLYLDPYTKDNIKNSKWIVEEYYLPRTEVWRRIQDGEWYLRKDKQAFLENVSHSSTDMDLGRYFGVDSSVNQSDSTLYEDDLVQCFDYWQFPTQGLGDVYGTLIGGMQGELVRYGRNPLPFKGCHFAGASYNPSDKPDGRGLIDLNEYSQKVINTFYNLRATDIRKNSVAPLAIAQDLVDAQTQEDFANGNMFIRTAPEMTQKIFDSNKKMQDFMAPIPTQRATDGIFADLEWIIGQGQKSANISDAFRGMMPDKQVTLGQIQESISRNTSMMTPVLRGVMSVFERIGQICIEYFKNPEYFPEERILRITGKNKYKDIISGFQTVGGHTHIRTVTPDEMDVDVTIRAVNASDVQASRTLFAHTVERFLHSMGQSPDYYQDLKKKYKLEALFERMMTISGFDLEEIQYTDEEKKQMALEQQQQMEAAKRQQMEMAQMQLKFREMEEQIKAQADLLRTQGKTQGQIQVAQQKALIDVEMEELTHQGEMEATESKIDLETLAEIVIRKLEHKQDLERMQREYELESKANVSVGRENNNIQVNNGAKGKND